MKNIKDAVKKNYTSVVIQNQNGCCGCGPSCCDENQEISFLNESYQTIKEYETIADYGLGCGLPTEIAEIKEGDTVLDLGSGAGNDVFIVSKRVGETGKVIGIDFTEAMIEKANENKQKLKIKNAEFILGDIENLPIQDKTINIVISNCVLNLVPDKVKAFGEIYRVLKDDGYFSISDVVLTRELPTEILNAPEMYSACISGALEKNLYLKIIEKCGFTDIEIVKEHEIKLPDNYLLRYSNKKEQSPILSITVKGKKTKKN
jgi:arsenite methyltransferase